MDEGGEEQGLARINAIAEELETRVGIDKASPIGALSLCGSGANCDSGHCCDY